MAEVKCLASISKNGRETVRVAISEYRGHRYVDVRTFATAADASLVPTPKGIGLRLDMLPKVVEALQEAERMLRAEGGLS